MENEARKSVTDMTLDEIYQDMVRREGRWKTNYSLVKATLKGGWIFKTAGSALSDASRALVFSFACRVMEKEGYEVWRKEAAENLKEAPLTSSTALHRHKKFVN